MLEQNRPYAWGEPVRQWICEHCGIESNSLDHNGNFAHVYRQALHDGGPLLDLCLPCRPQSLMQHHFAAHKNLLKLARS